MSYLAMSRLNPMQSPSASELGAGEGEVGDSDEEEDPEVCGE